MYIEWISKIRIPCLDSSSCRQFKVKGQFWGLFEVKNRRFYNLGWSSCMSSLWDLIFCQLDDRRSFSISPSANQWSLNPFFPNQSPFPVPRVKIVFPSDTLAWVNLLVNQYSLRVQFVVKKQVLCRTLNQNKSAASEWSWIFEKKLPFRFKYPFAMHSYDVLFHYSFQT